ncbi:MAG: flagellar biosynthesis protein FlgA, partial [Alphaproteobacteria bacterium]|nr:flagellar biosynthesis protein FlgA [Alphaproteobacteria bacterium]
MSAPHFVVHDKTDSVGVIVVETVEANTEMTGWVME